MNIKFYPKYTPSFCAKKSEIRKADDIQRKTRTAFPFFSPHYADTFYRSCAMSYSAKNSDAYLKHWNNVDRLDEFAMKLNCIRENRWEELCGRNNFLNKAQQTIKDIQKYGLANCEEASTLTLAALIANGYQNSSKCSLKLDTAVIEKSTGEEKLRFRDSLDHAFVISTMDKDPSNKKDIYVLDSWYGFADSISGAKARYMQLTTQDIIKKSRQKAINKFIQLYKSKYESANKPFNIEDFEVRQNITYDFKETPSEQDREKIKALFQEKYPNLMEGLCE